jgi:hypothetical protein
MENRERRQTKKSSDGPLDLHSQLEELLNSVWTCEKDWRFDDRIDVALKVGKPKPQR